MRIATVTLNPAIDRNIIYENSLTAGQLNRVNSAVVNAGGKGINVSRMLKKLKMDTQIYGFNGGRAGKMLEDILRDEGIECEFTPTECETRMNIKITDSESKETEINEKGGPVKEEEFKKLMSILLNSPADIFIIGGSTPFGLESDTVRRITAALKLRGKTVITDISGSSLVEAVKERPYLIKPNREEFSQLLGYTPEDDKCAEEAIGFYNKTGIEIILTLGKKGAVYSGRAGNYRVINPEVKAKGFSGAGDTFLASYVYAVCNDMDIRKSLAFASAASLSKVELEGTNLPDKEAIENNIPRVKVFEI
ncbi:MAG: 1-phosphofructokinase family hexose kinase [Clostridia bacterium]|nr:1-phosphofructokinase family hexose kinase [Clostridia bacterium]